jgi:hypothetical protein
METDMDLATLRAVSLCAALACAAPLARALTPQSGRPAAMQPPRNEALRQELLRMYEEDQAARLPMTTGKGMSGVNEAEIKKQIEVDATHTKRLSEIFKRYGFPAVPLVGRDGAQAAFVMVVHSPSLDLKKKALPYIRKAARRGEVPAEAFATLTDTILRAEGKPQIYGTKFDLAGGKLVLAPTVDPARLDARRAKLGLPPISEYAKGLAEMYKMPVDVSGVPR